MTAASAPLPPVQRAISVSWAPAAAFQRFTAEFANWWPSRTHSIGGSRVKRIVFECRLGGRIYEELTDGRRFQWGRVTAWEPPGRVAFTFHPSREPEEAQDVEVTFSPAGTGTLLTLTSTGWERLGAKGRRQQKAYGIGWGAVLSVYAGRRNAAFHVFGVISAVITFALKITGRLEAAIDKSGGRMPADAP